MLGRFGRKPLLGTPINWSHPLAQGLVGLWLFNEGSGGIVYDLSLNDNNGILTDMVPGEDWVSDRDGYVLDFDGTNDSIDIGSPSNFSAGFTVSLWINMAVLNDFSVFIGDYDAQAGDEGWAVRVLDDNDFGFSHGGSGGFQNQAFSSSSNLDDGLWHHLVVAVDSDVGGATGYQDLEQFNLSFNANTLDTSSLDLIIGSGRSSDNSPKLDTSYEGKLSDIRIYSRVLTTQEVHSLYTEPYAIFKKSS